MAELIYRRQLLLAKPETVVDTDAMPTAADNSMLVRDVTYGIEMQQLERPLMLADISNVPQRPGRSTVTVTFTVEVKGSGIAGKAPALGTLLRGCGFAETELPTQGGFEYDPVSSNFESLTIYWYADGILHKATGCRGSFNLTAPAGDYSLVSFTFQGSYIEPVDAPLPVAPAYEASLPPIVELAELSVLELTACAAQFTIDAANTINPRLCVNAAKGVSGYSLTERNVTGSFNPEATLMAEFNPFKKLTDGEVGDFSVKIGLEDNNKCVITGHCQYTGVSPTDRDGTLSWEIPIRFVRVTGNDEIKFSFPQVP